MTIRNLEKFFVPQTVALFGASKQEDTVGQTVMENLHEGGFHGPVWLVNPHYREIGGHPCYPDTQSLPTAPDLAIITTPVSSVLDIIIALGEKGTKAVVVLTVGLRQQHLTQALLDAARPHCMRIVGPNSLGLMVPGIGLNASFAHTAPLRGDLAFLSQSGAVISTALDWAREEDIGFSCLVSMGDMADVDLGDMLDYLALDSKTRAILMYLEQVTDACKFMSAARSAARLKPVVVIKSGRHAEAAKAAYSHTGALTGSDIVYNAAFHRAGILRVLELEDLFDAAEALSHLKPMVGDRLAIVTNGGGVGVLAVDRLMDYGGHLAQLSEQTIDRLEQVLPPTWSQTNPIDITDDAGPKRYEAALEAVLDASEVDAVLVMNCSTALASSVEAASATLSTMIRYKQKHPSAKPILTSWLGDGAAREARQLLSESGYPTYHTPADAVRGFTYLTQYARAQRALMQTPPSLPEHFKTNPEAARQTIRGVLSTGREILTELEGKAILKVYGIPTVNTVLASTPDEVKTAAADMIRSGCLEVVVKILSPDITHKSDVRGVSLSLPSAEIARAAAQEMLSQIQAVQPEARIAGFAVQPMIRRPHAYELIIGVSEDPTFGPVILFGAGGTAVQVVKDAAVALPPLDLKLAYDLMEKTQVYKLLQGYRDHPAADMKSIALTLVRVSHMIAELPEIVELDINPLLADEHGVVALDARIVVKETNVQPGTLNPRFAIRPYPKQWERYETLPDGKLLMIRPIRPEDERYFDVFMEHNSPEDIKLRLFTVIRRLSHEFLAHLTQIDYARAMAFIAIDPTIDEMLGVAHLTSDPDSIRAEYAVMTRSDRKRRGIGRTLMQRQIHYAQEEGIQELWGQVMRENTAMLQMCQALDFQIERDPDDSSLVITRLVLAISH